MANFIYCVEFQTFYSVSVYNRAVFKQITANAPVTLERQLEDLLGCGTVSMDTLYLLRFGVSTLQAWL